MRTNIDIDDALMAEAQKVSGQATKKQTVEQALRLIKVAQSASGRCGVWQVPLARRPCAQPQGAGPALIVVDTSVWIDFLNGRSAPHVTALKTALGRTEIVSAT